MMSDQDDYTNTANPYSNPLQPHQLIPELTPATLVETPEPDAGPSTTTTPRIPHRNSSQGFARNYHHERTLIDGSDISSSAEDKILPRPSYGLPTTRSEPCFSHEHDSPENARNGARSTQAAAGSSGSRNSIYNRRLPQLPSDEEDLIDLEIDRLTVQDRPASNVRSSSVGANQMPSSSSPGSNPSPPKSSPVKHPSSSPRLPIRDEFMQGRVYTPTHQGQHHHRPPPEMSPMSIALHHEPEARNLHEFSSLHLVPPEPASIRVANSQNPRRSSAIFSPLSPIDQGQSAAGGPPRWQPDVEAIDCPICHTRFTMFYRRHHCRVCGRVVCASCSPHRIVIPNSCVVYPPNLDPATAAANNGISPELAALAGLAVRATAGTTSARPNGYQDDVGVEVRICESCLAGETESNRRRRRRTVDTSEPGSAAAGAPGGAGRFWEDEASMNSAISAQDASTQPGRRRSRSSAYGLNGRPPAYHHHHSQSLGRNAVQSHHLQPGGSSSSPNIFPSPSSFTAPPNWQSTPPPTGASSTSYTGSPGRPQYYSPSRYNNASPRTEPPPNPASFAPPERTGPPLLETDYCPICTLPLPAIPSSGDETLREEHITDCIRRAESAVSPQEAGRQLGGSLPSSSSETPPDMVSGSMGRLGASGRGGRMVVYKATEKDTLSKRDGEPVECVICLEDLEVGESIARLECLCVYHKKCIRSWFDHKGNGKCPVHAIHD